MAKEEKVFMDLEEASQKYKFAIKTFQNKIAIGFLTRYGTRGKILLDKAEVEAKMVYTQKKPA